MPATYSVLQSPAEPPFPIQAGIVPDCVSWLQAFAKEDSCSWLADRAGIQPTDLYEYNPFLGEDGENCAADFLPNYWYCVGTSSTPRNEALAVPPSITEPPEDVDPIPTITTTATLAIAEPGLKKGQNMVTAPSPALTPGAAPLRPSTTATTLPVRIPTITMDDHPAPISERAVVDAAGGRLREVEKGEGPETVTKTVTLVRRNRWMARHQGEGR
ncbi:hypothetical protein F4775DRAFT_601061 [Biscogniauxia sp. FL1348]|nr:hypothetical protein F4775DRAFT_601061 [Biscogniauxia sp. FL1348]